MRIVKVHEERRREILDTAQRLFVQVGYERCTVNKILEEIGIAKGTFYHYFKSKEEVLDAIIEGATGFIVARIQKVAEDTSLSPEDKLLNMFLCMNIKNEQSIFLKMQNVENALVYQKTIASILKWVTPYLVEQVKEGNEKGIFRCAYPEQYMEILVASGITLMNEFLFQTETKKQHEMSKAFITMFSMMLGVEDDLFWNKIIANLRNKYLK